MPKIIFIDHNGSKKVVETKAGTCIMEAAVQNLIPGIDADCGGACACATCHVYVEKEWLEKLTPKDDMEESMLDFDNGSLAVRKFCSLNIQSSVYNPFVKREFFHNQWPKLWEAGQSVRIS